MARSRNVKPGVYLNDILAGLTHWIRLLFIYIWTIADKAGRLVDNPRRIGATVFPYEGGLPIDEGLQQLADAGFIRRYTVDGNQYIQILAWDKHQNPHRRENESTIPPFEQKGRELVYLQQATALPVQASAFPGQAPAFPERAGLIPDSLNLIPDSRSLGSNSESDPSEPETGSNRTAAKNRTLKWTKADQEADAPTSLVDAFEVFWRLYPNAVGRQGALQAWISLIGTGEITRESLGDVMAGLQRWRDSQAWAQEDGKFIQSPTTFLVGNGKGNLGRMWRDNPPVSVEIVAKRNYDATYAPPTLEPRRELSAEEVTEAQLEMQRFAQDMEAKLKARRGLAIAS